MRRKILVIFFASFILLNFIYITINHLDIIVKADEETSNNINVMFTSDWHIGSVSDSDVQGVVDDVNNNVNCTVLFHLGDFVNGPFGNVGSEWDKWYSWYDNLTGTSNIIYKGEVLGNHEGYYERWNCDGSYHGYDETLGWGQYSRFAPTNGSREYCYNHQGEWGENYTYQYGNVLFIILPLQNRVCPDGGVATNCIFNTSIYIDWVNKTIQDNQDKNIFILCHLGIETGTQDYYYGLLHQDDYYWMMEHYKVVAWIHGHTHGSPSCTEVHSAYHFNDGKATGSGDTSIMINFTKGSEIANVVIRHHDSHTWDETIGSYDTITLDYAFDPTNDNETNDNETTPQFISINGQTNGTTNHDSTPTINWTIVTNASQYWLQIDNNQDFSSPEINITDINQWNYPSNCDINATRVSFTLPDDNNLPDNGTYYMRVKAYI